MIIIEMTKLRVGLLFGGCSGEHEVSINSARAIARSLKVGENGNKYEIIPVYIQKDGIWRGGETAAAILTSETTPEPSNNPGQIWQFPPEVREVNVWFPILHGPNGEDGTVQGLLQLMQVPFVGSGILGSSLGMDKIATKMAFAAAGLPQVKYKTVTRSQVWSNPCVFPKIMRRYRSRNFLSLLRQTS